MNVEVIGEARLLNTSDSRLDGEFVSIIGEYGKDGIIVAFRNRVEGYNPAIVISKHCIVRIK